MTARGPARAALAATLALVGACFYPDYSFDEAEPTGTGSGGATSSSSGGGDTTTTTSSTTSTTSTGGAGGGGGPPVEDCFDGADNDGDTLADCADPDCAPDAECVDPIPVGWGTLGHVALFQGVEGSNPACPAAMPDTAFTGTNALSASPAICSACTCGAPSGQSCALATDLDSNVAGLQPIQVKNLPCGQNATALSVLTVPAGWDGSCFQAENLAAGQTCAGADCNASATSSLPSVSGGSCTPGGGVPTLPAPTWAIEGKACRAASSPATGCDAGKQCRPRPAAPFAPHVCVSKPGDLACPDPYSDKHLFYTDFTDTRACTACTCGGANGGSCQITIHLYSDAGAGVCSTEDVAFVAGQCKNLTGNPAVYGRSSEISSPPSGGMCPVTGGGAPIGGAAPTGPRTFCCLP